MRKLLLLKILLLLLFFGSSGNASLWFFEGAVSKFLGPRKGDEISHSVDESNASNHSNDADKESVVDLQAKSKHVTFAAQPATPVQKKTTKLLPPAIKTTPKKLVKNITLAPKRALRSEKAAPIAITKQATKVKTAAKTSRTPPKRFVRSTDTPPVAPVKPAAKKNVPTPKRALRLSEDATHITTNPAPKASKKSPQKSKAISASSTDTPAKKTRRSAAGKSSPESENPSPSKVIKKPVTKKTRPDTVPKKSRGKAPVPTAVAPPAHTDANAIEQHRLLTQPNGWECGYYSIFHYLATKHDYEGAELEELYAAFIATITQNPLVAARYNDEEYTNGEELSNIITALAGTDFAADLNEVLVVDEREFHETVPTTQNVVNKINALRERGETFWALVCTRRPAHWVCLMFPAEGGCFGIDSLHRSRPANNQAILVGIKNLCLGIVPLPNGEQYHTTYENYRVISHQPESAAKNEIIEAIQAEALANGFTEETFASLRDYIDKLPLDHFPGAEPDEKKKRGPTAQKSKAKC